MKRYNYVLIDDGGANDLSNQQILIPLGTKFLHEFGLYQVSEYVDRAGNTTKKTANIYKILCDRLKTNQELKKAIK